MFTFCKSIPTSCLGANLDVCAEATIIPDSMTPARRHDARCLRTTRNARTSGYRISRILLEISGWAGPRSDQQKLRRACRARLGGASKLRDLTRSVQRCAPDSCCPATLSTRCGSRGSRGSPPGAQCCCTRPSPALATSSVQVISIY